MMPNGRVHCAVSERRAAACAHGRLDASARLRARHATTDVALSGRDRHRGVADHAAAGTTTESDLREERDVAEAHVASDIHLAERLQRERREPVDFRGRDTGVVECEGDRLARERQLRVGETLAELRLADPDDCRLVLDEGRAHQPFHSGVRRSRNDATPSPESSV